jgi:hypothetical protein
MPTLQGLKQMDILQLEMRKLRQYLKEVSEEKIILPPRKSPLHPQLRSDLVSLGQGRMGLQLFLSRRTEEERLQYLGSLLREIEAYRGTQELLDWQETLHECLIWRPQKQSDSWTKAWLPLSEKRAYTATAWMSFEMPREHYLGESRDNWRQLIYQPQPWFTQNTFLFNLQLVPWRPGKIELIESLTNPSAPISLENPVGAIQKAFVENQILQKKSSQPVKLLDDGPRKQYGLLAKWYNGSMRQALQDLKVPKEHLGESLPLIDLYSKQILDGIEKQREVKYEREYMCLAAAKAQGEHERRVREEERKAEERRMKRQKKIRKRASW